MSNDILSQRRGESQLPPFLGVPRFLLINVVISFLPPWDTTREKRPIIPKWGSPWIQTPDEEGMISL